MLYNEAVSQLVVIAPLQMYISSD